MEFIPIEKTSKKGKKKVVIKKEIEGKKVQKNEPVGEKPLRKGKIKPQRKIIEKKEVKEKRKEKITKKKGGKGGKKQKKEEEEDEEEEEENEDVEMNESINEEAEDEESDDEVDEEEDEEAFRKKCEEMDNMKKNRLFIKMKKKITNEAEIKELHPDIRSVIFPRKKRPRWCWAVFDSEERAKKAMRKIIKIKDVLVNKPTPYARVVQKRKKKMTAVQRRKEVRQKLKKMWS